MSNFKRNYNQKFSLLLSVIILFLISLIINPLQAKENVGVNLTDIIYWETNYAFIDVFKGCNPWVGFKNVPPVGTILDENGWPKYLPKDSALTTIIMQSAAADYPAGKYVCLYDGEGTIVFGGDAKAGTSTPGRIEVNVTTPSTKGITVKITSTDPKSNSNYLRNIRLLLPGMENREKEIFNPAFIDHYKDFSTFRFMKWSLAEVTYAVTWQNRVTPQYFSYGNNTMKGVPTETMIKLCNLTKKNMWFTMPPMANYEYQRKTAELIKDSLDPSLKLYIEYGNETFNSAYPLSTIYTWDGILKQATNTYQIFDSVFAEQKTTRLIKTHGFAFRRGYEDGFKQLLDYKPDGVTPFGSIIDEAAVAPYYGYTSTTKSTNSNAPGVSDIVVSEKWTVDQLFDWVLNGYVGLKQYTNYDIIPQYSKTIQLYKNEVDKYSKKLNCYEIGHHLYGWDMKTLDPYIQTLYPKAWQHPRMYDLYSKFLKDFRKINPESVMNIFTSASRSAGGLFPSENVSNPLTYTKYKACVDFINGSTTPLNYYLNVDGGTSTGSYLSGTKVNVVAGIAPEGKVFDRWKGDTQYLSDSLSASAVYTVPESVGSLVATYKLPASINDISSDLSIYPNPVNNTLNLRNNIALNGNIQLVNMQGVVLKRIENIQGKSNLIIDMQDVPKGIYILQFSTENIMGIKRIIKQ